LEDVNNDGQVLLVAIGALNGAQQQTPSAALEPNLSYTITLRLRFTIWMFSSGHRIRLAISDGMFSTYWPSPFTMNTSLFLNPITTFIDLPVILPLSTTTSSPPLFTQLQTPLADILSESFSSVKPRIYQKDETDLSTRIIFERITYELLPSNTFMSTLLTWNFTCSHLNPADVRWTAQARQIYVYDMHRYTLIDQIPMTDDDLLKKRHFELKTDLTVHSDEDYFYIHFKRQLFTSNGTTNATPVTFVFNNKYKRYFQ
jgi:hypothetical protein